MPRLTPEQKTKKLNKILDHIRLNYYLYKKYPTFVCIENKFHTNLRTHGLNIRKLYRLANIPYKRDPNPFLRYKKERKLTEITKKLFQKLGYNIKNTSIGPSKPIGADIVLEDEQKRLIPLEIKAYQKFGKIGQSKYSPYIRDEINQLKGYIKHLYASHGYLVTSTDRRTLKSVPENIKIIFGQDLKKLLLQFRMHKELKDLDWVRNSSISYGKKEYKRKVAKKILNYVKKKMNQGKYVGEREIYEPSPP